MTIWKQPSVNKQPFVTKEDSYLVPQLWKLVERAVAEQLCREAEFWGHVVEEEFVRFWTMACNYADDVNDAKVRNAILANCS